MEGRATVLELKQIYCGDRLVWARRVGDLWICARCNSTLRLTLP